jgi:hypothetical protein
LRLCSLLNGSDTTQVALTLRHRVHGSSGFKKTSHLAWSVSVRWPEIVQIMDGDLLLAALGARLLSLLRPAKRHVSEMRRRENVGRLRLHELNWNLGSDIE